MPVADTVLLPLAAGITLLGLLIAILAGRRGHRGRAVQGVGLALAPLALYLSGLLRLLWDGGVALTRWASSVILSPPVWAGLALLAVCLVLWVVGGVIARRAPSRPRRTRDKAMATSAARPAVARKGQAPPAQQAPPVDDDMAEIEALLKARGIE